MVGGWWQHVKLHDVSLCLAIPTSNPPAHKASHEKHWKYFYNSVYKYFQCKRNNAPTNYRNALSALHAWLSALPSDLHILICLLFSTNSVQIITALLYFLSKQRARACTVKSIIWKLSRWSVNSSLRTLQEFSYDGQMPINKLIYIINNLYLFYILWVHTYLIGISGTIDVSENRRS